MRLVLTGGHLTPALAFMQYAQARGDSGLLIGRQYASHRHQIKSREAETATGLGFDFAAITPVKFDRYHKVQSIISLPKLVVALFQAYRLLKRFRPDVVVSFGGYLAVPVCYAAWLQKIPIILHEQTTTQGLANRLITPVAAAIGVGFSAALTKYPPTKTKLVGNPIRRELLQPSQQPSWLSTSPAPLIYVTGGNQGSHPLNQIIEASIPDLLSRYTIVHQTGSSTATNDYHRLVTRQRELDPELRDKYLVFQWLDAGDVNWLMEHSHVIISRSGANTVTEIMLKGTPAILIPLSNTAGDEQVKNAQMMASLGIAEVINQVDLSPERLAKTIDQITANYNHYHQQLEQVKAESQIHQHAVANLYHLVSHHTEPSL